MRELSIIFRASSRASANSSVPLVPSMIRFFSSSACFASSGNISVPLNSARFSSIFAISRCACSAALAVATSRSAHISYCCCARLTSSAFAARSKDFRDSLIWISAAAILIAAASAASLVSSKSDCRRSRRRVNRPFSELCNGFSSAAEVSCICTARSASVTCNSSKDAFWPSSSSC